MPETPPTALTAEPTSTPLSVTVPEPTEPLVILGGPVAAIAIHRHYKVEDLEHTLPNPRRIRTTVEFDDPESFAQYLNHMVQPNDHCIVLYEANAKPPFCVQFRAVLDYHDSNADPEAMPHWCKHAANYTAVFSDQFTAWMASHEKPFTPSDFADFVEDNAGDFVEPEAARMIDIAMNLNLAKQVSFKRHERKQDGSLTYHFDENVTPGASGVAGDIAIPHTMKINVPIFLGAAPVPITALFRYRAERSEGITFHYKIPELNRLVREAIVGLRGLVPQIEAAITIEGRMAILNGRFARSKT